MEASNMEKELGPICPGCKRRLLKRIYEIWREPNNPPLVNQPSADLHPDFVFRAPDRVIVEIVSGPKPGSKSIWTSLRDYEGWKVWLGEWAHNFCRPRGPFGSDNCAIKWALKHVGRIG